MERQIWACYKLKIKIIPLFSLEIIQNLVHFGVQMKTRTL